MSPAGERGFTLIELVVVIVILGILAAVAVPLYVDLSSDAKAAAVSGVAGALASASALNYAARSANSSKGVAISNCTDVTSALQGTLTGYTIGSATITGAGVAVTCTVTQTSGGATQTFVAIGA